jgi:hypothetical protein
MRHRLVLGLAAVGAATGLALVPAAATAAGTTLYTWAYNPVGTDAGGFATTSTTDAALALLGADTFAAMYASGTEVCGGTGYAVGEIDGGDSDDTPVVATFDVSTGAITSGPTALTIVDGTVTDVWEADTLEDCTLLAIAGLEGDYAGVAVVEVNPATGVVEIVAELPEIEDVEYTGLATDSTGVTYLFGDVESQPWVTVLDLVIGTFPEPSLMTGLANYYESGGFTLGVDFDAADGLWIVNGVDAEEQYHLTSYASGADLALDEPVDIGILPYYDNPNQLQISSPIPLAAGPTPPPTPVLAATGSTVPIAAIALGGLLAFAGVGALVAARRRAA